MNKSIVVIAVLFVIAGANCTKIVTNGSVRAVEFISILAFGFLGGMLIKQLVKSK